MNTSKLDDILEDVFMVGVQHESRTVPEIDKLLAKARDAIVEAVEGLINDCMPFNTVGGIEMIARQELLQAIKEWQT